MTQVAHKIQSFFCSWQSAIISLFVISLLTLTTVLVGCERQPPDQRAPVTLPESTAGDAINGKQLYHDLCDKCHKLTPGSNGKGPQLLRIYGAPAGSLKDYEYSEVMANSGWVWDEKTLNHYLIDAQLALPGNRMRTDGVPDAKERADIIAYLSTLRGSGPGDGSGSVATTKTALDTNATNQTVEMTSAPKQ